MSATTFLQGTVISSDWLNDLDALRYGGGDATRGAALLQFLQAGTGAVADTVQGFIRGLPFISVLDFCSAAKRTAILAGTQTDITAELVLAAVPRKPILLPKGSLEISSPVSIESDMFGAGADDDYTKIVLTGTGQLVVDQPRMHWSGLWITSAVNALTFVKVRQSYFRFDNFVIQATGTTQVGFELDTTTSGGIAFSSFDKFLINAAATSFKITGTGYANGNKFGERGDSWQSFTQAIDIQNTGGTQVNSIGGYFESAVNPSSVVKANAGATVQDNTFNIHPDSGAAVMNVANNNGGTFGLNTWIDMPPELFISTGTVLAQRFSDPILARAYLSADQTGIVDATFTKLAFDTVSWDTSNATAFVVATSRYVAKRNQRVRLTSRAAIGANLVAGNAVFMSIYKNGVEFQRAADVYPNVLFISDAILLSKDDYLEIFVRGDGSGAHTVSGGAIGGAYLTVEEL